MKKAQWINLFLLLLLLACSKGVINDLPDENDKIPEEQTSNESLIGKVLPKWQEGYLDIHAINTGRGECTFFIFPDGTTMLLDGSSSLISENDEFPPPPRKPNDNITSGKAIANYIKYYLPKINNKLNYILISHFHGDHMGSYRVSGATGADGNFTMNGITEIGYEIPFDLIIDRGYPNYEYPKEIKSEPRMVNYINFINWAKTTYNASAEQFVVGIKNQIVLKKNASKYAEFKIQNLAASGKVWTGNGFDWITEFPEDLNELVAAEPNENIFSVVFHLTYGKFDYFTGGDIQYNGRTMHPWKDIEAPIAKVMSNVDVMKANHHGTNHTNSEALLNKLQPEVVLIHVWRSRQPNPETINRFFSANKLCKIFLTNLDQEHKQILGNNVVSRFRSTQGHIVVRVRPGGDIYDVFVLDDSNEKYEVINEVGPIKSK